MSRDINRAAIEVLKGQMERSRSWRKIMTTGGRHYFEHRQNHHKVVIELTEQSAKVTSISDGNRTPT